LVELEPAMRLSIRHQIVGPFVVLVVFVGIVGTAIVMAQFASATTAEFDAGLLHSIVLANDNLALLEADRLAQLRSATDTVGVAEAVAAGNTEALERLLLPIAANAQPAQLTIRVLDKQGRELLAVQQSGSGAPPRLSSRGAYVDESAVQNVLAGLTDAAGDKYVFLASEALGPIVHWVGSVRGERQVIGAVLLGEPLSDMGARIHGSQTGELVFYDSAGQVLSDSSALKPNLLPNVKQVIARDHPVRFSQSLGGHAYRLLVSDWTMRGRQLGYMAVALNADGLQASLGQIRLMLVLLFSAAALLALLVGVTLATRMTRPLERLIASIQVVSAGDLHHRAPAGPDNEIGYLSKKFNDMTGSLEQKSHELERACFASLAALARAIDARDPHTFEHSARVAAISHKIADAMDLSPDEREALRRSGLLHDIGKIAITDSILSTAGPLTNAEWEVVRRHPVTGHEMLKDVPFLIQGLPGVRHHHERWDGQGCPDGLRGDAIPLQARILAVADAFDAMTSERSFRKSFSFEFAARAISTGSGTQFDPAVAEAFASRAEEIIALMQDMGKVPMPADIQWLEQAV